MTKKKKKKFSSFVPQIKEARIKNTPLVSPGRFVLIQHLFPAIILSIFSLALYIQTISFDYALDDKMVITGNKFTQKGVSGIRDIFMYESFRGFLGKQSGQLEGERYRPLSIASFAVEKSLFGSNKAISHLINVLLYTLTGVLLYRVLFFLFPAGQKSGQRWYLTIPFIATLLFLIHPLHVEVVANIKGRDEILAFLGEMAVLYFTFKYLSENKAKYLIFSFLAFCGAIFSKEVAITFVVVVPLTAYFFTNSTGWNKIKVTLPVVTGILVYLVLRVVAIGYLFESKEVPELINNPFYGMSFGEKTATIFYTLLLYLKLHIFPHPLTHDYYPYQIPIMNWGQWQPILSLLLHIAMILLIVIGWKKKTIWAYVSCFYLVTLSIVSNFVISVGTFMNERFVYQASLGFCIAVACLTGKGIKNNLQRGVALVILIILIAGFSIKTLLRVPDWRNNVTLETAAVKYSPNSARANCFYAINIWENVYKKLPANATPSRRKAVLDSLNPYIEKSFKILPSYFAAQGMRTGVATEYHKLTNNYSELIRVFEELNRSGSNERFIIQYLQYLNQTVRSKADAEKLLGYYSRMKEFYKTNFTNTGFLREYEQLHTNLLQKIQGLS